MVPIIPSSLTCLVLAWNGSLQVEESTVVAFHTHVFPKEEQSTGKVSYAWLDDRQRQVGGSIYPLNVGLVLWHFLHCLNQKLELGIA